MTSIDIEGVDIVSRERTHGSRLGRIAYLGVPETDNSGIRHLDRFRFAASGHDDSRRNE